MKKVTAIMVLCLLLTACNGGDSSVVSEDSSLASENSSESGSSAVSGDNSSDSTDDSVVFCDFVGDYPENPLTLLTASKEDIAQMINAQPNMVCAENLYLNIPQSASVYNFCEYATHVSQFIYSAEQYTSDFMATFEYFFPDRELNMDYLQYRKYLGYYDNAPHFDEGYVKDNENLPDGVKFTYNEMPEEVSEWPSSSPIYMELVNEIGAGSGIINKGEAVQFVGKKRYEWQSESIVSSDVYNKLSSFSHFDYFDVVATYSPQSEESFNLLDGEVRICDAVKFVEDYLNNAPISTGLTRNMRTSVYKVQVMKLDENTYGYYFQTCAQFMGVNFEPAVLGSGSNYDYYGSIGEAFMIRSDDVDYINSFWGTSWTFDIENCSSVVPVETAIENISQKMSSSVTFEVDTVEFVYVEYYKTDENGYIDVDLYEGHVSPAWRITMHNPNDGYEYMCYVDAVDGGNFRYYRRVGEMSFDG